MTQDDVIKKMHKTLGHQKKDSICGHHNICCAADVCV